MEGSWLTNREFVALVRSGEMVIDPFDPARLRLARYRLSPGRLLTPVHDESGTLTGLAMLRDFAEDSSPFVLGPHDYVIVEVLEAVVLPTGFEGRMSPVSSLVDQGLGLTAGNLDAHFGRLGGERQRVRIGLANLMSVPNAFDPSLGVAHLAITDLRSAPQDEVAFTQDEIQQFRQAKPRYHRDAEDGVTFPETDIF